MAVFCSLFRREGRFPVLPGFGPYFGIILHRCVFSIQPRPSCGDSLPEVRVPLFGESAVFFGVAGQGRGDLAAQGLGLQHLHIVGVLQGKQYL